MPPVENQNKETKDGREMASILPLNLQATERVRIPKYLLKAELAEKARHVIFCGVNDQVTT